MPMEAGQQFLTPAESHAVDGALLSQSEKFLTRLTISSFRLLQTIAAEEQLAIADLTRKLSLLGLKRMPKGNGSRGQKNLCWIGRVQICFVKIS